MGTTFVQPKAESVVIASGAALSGAINLQGGLRQLVALQMPATWATADLTFDVSADGTTYGPLYWNGAEFTVEAAGGAVASAAISLDPAVFAGWPFVKVRSGTSGTPVNQGADRVVTALTREV